MNIKSTMEDFQFLIVITICKTKNGINFFDKITAEGMLQYW